MFINISKQKPLTFQHSLKNAQNKRILSNTLQYKEDKINKGEHRSKKAAPHYTYN